MTDFTNFYGLSENPFDVSPDARFFFPSESHGEALASLHYGISQRKGFVLILGEAGIGKTTLIHHLLETLDAKVKIVLFPQSHLPFEQLLKEMLLKLNLPLGLEIKGSMMHVLYYHLIECLKQDENVVIIIDEAQNISLNLMEEVRLLANLETSTSKLLQIVLVGQPELREKLRSEAIRQFKQRIAVSYEIKPLTPEESLQYIDHRLRIVGSSCSTIFTEKALSLICRHAKGIPLALNILCHNAMFFGHGLSEKRITPSTVKKIRHKKELLTIQRTQSPGSGLKRYLTHKILSAILALGIVAIVIFFGKDYVHRLFTAQKSGNSVAQPAVKDNVRVAPPEEKHRAVVESDPETVSRGGMDAASNTPPIAALSPPVASIADTGIRVKEIAEAGKGTNLYLLAHKYYKESDETRIDHILKLNPEITDPNLILVGQKIKIPEITESLLIMQYGKGLYQVHLRTFRNPNIAVRYTDNIPSRKKEIEIIPWKVSPKETWYRVVARPFATREEGLKYLEEMKQKGFFILPSKAEK